MAIQTLNELSELFSKQSANTWKRLGYVRESHGSGVPWGSVRVGEEAITSLLLLELYEQGCVVAYLQQTSRRCEAKSGTDFELWLGSRSKGYFGFAIQAKKLDVRTDRYSSLNHSNQHGKQIELLEKHARIYDTAPFYCLYNHTADATESDHWHCCTGLLTLRSSAAP